MKTKLALLFIGNEQEGWLQQLSPPSILHRCRSFTTVDHQRLLPASLLHHIKNKVRPESSIAEGYVADEALTFCSMYLEGMQTKFNCADKNDDLGLSERKFYAFSSQCLTVATKKIVELCKEVK
ncbi:unnamed protein product [Lactuca saligna]|uniref:DUF4218 domain-containing protein n=1 Tax=Lactuca saligna TaxID=75948 RepID=A0AA36DZP5_LACSI|nr:unnamed protein product [Lactuca saligna]